MALKRVFAGFYTRYDGKPIFVVRVLKDIDTDESIVVCKDASFAKEDNEHYYLIRERKQYIGVSSRRQTDRQGRSARCADLRPCAVCKPSTYALEITHRLKRQMLWKRGQRWKYF